MRQTCNPRRCGFLLAAACLLGGAAGHGAFSAELPPQSSLEQRFLSPPVQITEGAQKAGEGYLAADGRRICYQAVPTGYPFYQIYVQDIDLEHPGPRPPRRVSPGRGRTTCSWFAPGGTRLLFASSHLDPDIDRTEAAARAQAEEDARTGRRRRYQWDFDPQMDIFTANLDGTGLVRLTQQPGYDAECSYSPDGTQILFVSDRDGDADIYVMQPDGTNVRQLTNAPGYDGGPFFSPDGRWITYRTDRVEKDLLQIHVMRADGTGDVPLTEGKGVRWAPFWHPTKPWLIWTGADHSDPTKRPNYDLWIAAYEATDEGFRIGPPVRLTDHEGADVLPSFSPDGTRLMWTASRGGGGDGGGRGSASQLWMSRFDLEAVGAALAEAAAGEGGKQRP